MPEVPSQPEDTRILDSMGTRLVLVPCAVAALFLSLFHCSMAINGSWMGPSLLQWNPIHYTLFPYALLQFGFLFFFWFTTFNMAARSRIFCILVLLPLMLNEIAHEYSASRYGVEYDTIIQAAFASTFEQIRPYLSPMVICALSALAVLIVAAVYVQGKYWKARNSHLLRWSILWSAAIILPLALCRGHRIGLPDCRYALCMYLQGSYHITCFGGDGLKAAPDYYNSDIYRDFVDRSDAVVRYIPFQDVVDWLQIGSDYYFPPELSDCADAPSTFDARSDQLTVVLYIAESWRHDHTPWSGYHRDTIPCFSRNFMQNTITFPNVMSHETSTIPSLYGILTDADEKDRKAKHNCFLSLFKKHGFRSTMAELTADYAPWHNTPVFSNLLKNCYDRFLELHEENDFRRIVRDSMDADKMNVLVIDDGTGHHPFENTTGVWGATLEDKYDEARLAMDKNLCAVIRELKGTPAILLFVADHGESFGEEGRYVHGGPLTAKEQRHVAAFVYYTDEYARLYPEIVENLRQNREAFGSHGNIFHTIPSLGGIHSSVQDEKMDMTKPHPRQVAESGAPAASGE